MPTNFDIQNGALNGPNEAYMAAFKGAQAKQAQQSSQDSALAQLIKGKQVDADNATRSGLEAVANKKTEQQNTMDADLSGMPRASLNSIWLLLAPST